MSVPPGWQIADTVSFSDFRLLPQDVLSEIFYCVAIALPGRQLRSLHAYDRAFKLVHVCRLWRQIILGMPTFWAAILSQVLVNVRFRNENNRFAFMLEKTGVLPLSIDIFDDVQGSLMELLIPHAFRISFVDIACTLPHLYRMLSEDLPHLQCLSYCDLEDVKGDYLRAPHIDLAKFPQLCSLTIPASLFRATTTFGNMRHLHVMDAGVIASEATHVFALHPFLEALRRCPGLETLTVAFNPKYTANVIDSGVARHHQAVHLPSLLKLTLSCVYGDGIVLLLHLLDIPSTAVLTIKEGRESFSHILPTNLSEFPYASTATNVALSMPDFLRACLKISAPCGRMTIFLDHADWSTRRSIRGAVNPGQWPSPYFLGDLANVLLVRCRFVTSFSIGPAAQSINLPAHIVAILQALPSLNHLSISDEADAVLNALDPIVRPPEGDECLCPSLSSLVLRWTSQVPFRSEFAGKFVRTHKGKDNVQVEHGGKHRKRRAGEEDDGGGDGHGSQSERPRTHEHLKISQNEWVAAESHPSYPAFKFYSRVIQCVQRRRVKRDCCALKELCLQVAISGRNNKNEGAWGPAELQEKFKGRLEGVVEQVTVISRRGNEK